MRRFDEEDHISDSIELMVSLLIRYPEFNTVKTDPKTDQIQFSFLLSGELSKEEFMEFRQELTTAIETYLLLAQKESGKIGCQYQVHDKYSMIEVTRDFKTISRQEMSLLIQFVYDYFGTDLLAEQQSEAESNDFEAQEEIIEDLLDRLQDQNRGDLLGFREAGRVMVFHKSSA